MEGRRFTTWFPQSVVTPTPEPSTATPTPELPTATPAQAFTLAASAEEIIGTWQHLGVYYIRFNTVHHFQVTPELVEQVKSLIQEEIL